MPDPTKRLHDGTLDALVLEEQEEGRRLGYGITGWLEARTDERTPMDESSLHSALHPRHEKGLVEAEWGTSELEGRAKLYRVTRKGRRRLGRAMAE